MMTTESSSTDPWAGSRENLRQWAALTADFYEALRDLHLPGRVCEDIVIAWATVNIVPDDNELEVEDDE